MDPTEETWNGAVSLSPKTRQAVRVYVSQNSKVPCRWDGILNSQREALTLAVILCWSQASKSSLIAQLLAVSQQPKVVQNLTRDICGKDTQNICRKFKQNREQIKIFFDSLNLNQLRVLIRQHSEILINIARIKDPESTISCLYKLGSLTSETVLFIILNVDSSDINKTLVVVQCTQSQTTSSQGYSHLFSQNSPSIPNIFATNKVQSLQKASIVSNQSYEQNPTNSINPHHNVPEDNRTPPENQTMEEVNKDNLATLKHTRSAKLDLQERKNLGESSLTNFRASQHSHNSTGSIGKEVHKDNSKQSNQEERHQANYKSRSSQDSPDQNRSQSLINRSQRSAALQHQGPGQHNQSPSVVQPDNQDPLDGFCQQCEQYQVIDSNNRLCWSCFQKKSKSQNDMDWLWILIFGILTTILVLLNYYHARQRKVTTGFEHVRILSTLSSQLYRSLFSHEQHVLTVSNDDF